MTERPPTVSFGLAVRNVVDVVGRCMESVLSQDFADLELVISDNASDDGTRDVLEEHDLARLSLPELRTLRRDAQRDEADLSYVRRLLQGRIDIPRAELAR